VNIVLHRIIFFTGFSSVTSLLVGKYRTLSVTSLLQPFWRKWIEWG